jgi:hypothetical protein
MVVPFRRLAWDPGITWLDSPTIDRDERIFIGENHLDFPLGFSLEEGVSLFSDSLRVCSASLWRQYVQLEEAMIVLGRWWRPGSFSTMVDCYFQEFTPGVQGIGSLVERFFEELTEFLQCRVALLIDSTQEASYVSTLPDSELSRGYFTSSRLVWDPGIIFSFSLVQLDGASGCDGIA